MTCSPSDATIDSIEEDPMLRDLKDFQDAEQEMQDILNHSGEPLPLVERNTDNPIVND